MTCQDVLFVEVILTEMAKRKAPERDGKQISGVRPRKNALLNKSKQTTTCDYDYGIHKKNQVQHNLSFVRNDL